MKRLDQKKTLQLFLIASITILLVGVIHTGMVLFQGFTQGPVSLTMGFLNAAYGVLAIQIEMNYRRNHLTFPSAYIFTGMMMSLVCLVISIVWFPWQPAVFYGIALVAYSAAFINNKIYFS